MNCITLVLPYGHTLHHLSGQLRYYAGGSGTKIGETTLLCNQLGYVFQNEHLGFDSKAEIELT